MGRRTQRIQSSSFRSTDSDKSNSSGAAPTTVLTVNLCVLVTGLTNRYLPKLIQGGVLLFALLPGLLAALRLGAPLWICLLSFVPAYALSMWWLGVPLARLLGIALALVGACDDFKRERVELFLCALRERPEWAEVDVICVQECYSSLCCPGGYPQQLTKGARAYGFLHAAVPEDRPAWPATFGMNSGLVILSKRPILWTACKAFGFSLEAGNVNRGALYAMLEDGVHVFTCHIAPAASVGGGGALLRLLEPLHNAARAKQVEELVSFIKEHAPVIEPAIVAGDFNLDIDFNSIFDPDPKPSSYALQTVALMKERCTLVEATSHIRGLRVTTSPACDADLTLQCCKPTFGYTGECAAHGPAELRLSSYGNGRLCSKCDDAVFFRGFIGVEVSEDSLAIPSQARPHAAITHLSDHWAVRASLHPHAASKRGAGPK